MRPGTGASVPSADRRGIALAVALFAIVLIGAMMGGVLFSSTQEFRTGRNSVTQERALSAAEYGVNQALNTWSAIGPNWLDVGAFEAPAAYVQANGTARVKVTRLSQTLVSIESEGTAGTGDAYSARRRAGMLVRFDIPDVHFRGALTVRGTVNIQNSTILDGNDTDPAGWPCVNPDTVIPALAINNASNDHYSGGCSAGACLDGSPDRSIDPAAGRDSTYFNYGAATTDTWADLVTNAFFSVSGTVNPGPVVSGSSCPAGPSNWGDPDRATPCKNYYPVIYAPGNLTVNGGKGQGVLVVNGDLTAQGGFRFYGPVIVRGRLTTSGSGATFVGGVMVANVNNSSTSLTHATITYSRCAATGALAFSAPPKRLAQRAWVDMF